MKVEDQVSLIKGVPNCTGLPVRQISNQGDLDEFLYSETFKKFYSFIQSLGEAVKGRRISDCSLATTATSLNVKWATKLIEDMMDIIEEYPPKRTSSRFGNPAFRGWLDRVRLLVPVEHERMKLSGSVEISSYLLNSLGDYQRIDYGTGHEAHFVAWLYCLSHSTTGPFFTTNDYEALVLVVFTRYIHLMRRLQSTYWLEPAGSHGVWGLDDYHFLPFLWGSAQLVDHPHLRPKSIHETDLVEEYSKEYLYLDCINSINQVKTAGLRWHSPMLDDISAVRSWEKVYLGLLKMYNAEVLGKVPIMQHFLFGEFLPFHSTAPKIDELYPRWHSMRGDCCGNPLPSIHAAAAGAVPPVSFEDSNNDNDDGGGGGGGIASKNDFKCQHAALSQLPFD